MRREALACIVLAAVGLLCLAGLARSQSAGFGISIPIMGQNHLASLDTPHPPYNSDPPTSGPHIVLLAPWGTYRIPIPKELQVHNLEDGGVLVQYNCRDCQSLIGQLEATVTRYNRVILAPYPGMEHKIALTAWGRLDAFDEFDEQRIMRFIEAYIGIDHHPGGEQCKLPREVRLNDPFSPLGRRPG